MSPKSVSAIRVANSDTAALKSARARFSSRAQIKSAIAHEARIRFDGACRLTACSAAVSSRSYAFFSVAGSIAGEGEGVCDADDSCVVCACAACDANRTRTTTSNTNGRCMADFLSLEMVRERDLMIERASFDPSNPLDQTFDARMLT